MALKARDKFIASQAIAQAYPSEIDANGYFVSHPETETDQVSDMTSFMKTLNKQGTDAAAVKTAIGAVDSAQYATDIAARLTREQVPAFNHRDEITTSGTYTAPVSGWYRITVKGGGGGGERANVPASGAYSGGRGGGEGGTTIGFERMTAGDTATVVIGAGGVANGGNGGDSTVTIGANTYTGGGGKGGGGNLSLGGTGTIPGASGCTAAYAQTVAPASSSISGGNGGGAGGGVSLPATSANGTNGGGGAGGAYLGTGYQNGGKGGDGFVWMEYFDGSLNP